MMNILAGEETLRRSRRTGKVLLIIECCNFLQLEIVSLLTNLFSSGTSTFGSIGSSKERDFKSKAWSMVQGSELLVEDRLASKLRILTFYITAKNLFFFTTNSGCFPTPHENQDLYIFKTEKISKVYLSGLALCSST